MDRRRCTVKAFDDRCFREMSTSIVGVRCASCVVHVASVDEDDRLENTKLCRMVDTIDSQYVLYCAKLKNLWLASLQ